LANSEVPKFVYPTCLLGRQKSLGNLRKKKYYQNFEVDSPTVSARYLDIRHEGQYYRQNVHGHPVHQSTSSWWLARKSLDGMRTGSPRSRNWRDIDDYDSGYKQWVTENLSEGALQRWLVLTGECLRNTVARVV